MKFVIPRAPLLAVRREARKRFPNEFLACIWGLRTASEIHVEQFKNIPHRSSPEKAEYDQISITRSKKAALRIGLEFIGTIHSHCWDPTEPTCHHLSLADLETSAVNGELLSGVIYVYNEGKNTEVHWFEPQIPPEIIYE